MVAKADPAVMPSTATMVREYATSMPKAFGMRYAASDMRRMNRLKPSRFAAAAMWWWGIFSKAFTKSMSACAKLRPSLAAASARKAHYQAHRWAPIPLPPSRLGICHLASHALAISLLDLIQMQIVVGKSPMGRRPPSDFGNSTINTSCHKSGHFPSISTAMKRLQSHLMSSTDNLATALGCILSPPSPV